MLPEQPVREQPQFNVELPKCGGGTVGAPRVGAICLRTYVRTYACHGGDEADDDNDGDDADPPVFATSAASCKNVRSTYA